MILKMNLKVTFRLKTYAMDVTLNTKVHLSVIVSLAVFLWLVEYEVEAWRCLNVEISSCTSSTYTYNYTNLKCIHILCFFSKFYWCRVCLQIQSRIFVVGNCQTFSNSREVSQERSRRCPDLWLELLISISKLCEAIFCLLSESHFHIRLLSFPRLSLVFYFFIS